MFYYVLLFFFFFKHTLFLRSYFRRFIFSSETLSPDHCSVKCTMQNPPPQKTPLTYLYSESLVSIQSNGFDRQNSRDYVWPFIQEEEGSLHTADSSLLWTGLVRHLGGDVEFVPPLQNTALQPWYLDRYISIQIYIYTHKPINTWYKCQFQNTDNLAFIHPVMNECDWMRCTACGICPSISHIYGANWMLIQMLAK